MHVRCNLLREILQNLLLLDKFILVFFSNLSISIIPVLLFFDPQSKVSVVRLKLLYEVSESGVLSLDLYALLLSSYSALLRDCYLPFKTLTLVFQLIKYLLTDGSGF